MESSRDGSKRVDSIAPGLANTPDKRLSEILKAACLDSTSTMPNNGPIVTVTSFGSSMSTASNNSSSHTEALSRISRWRRDWITDWWGLELICWLIATLSLLAIVVVLESHKSKPLPQWPFSITINSLVSVFATISQMAMMMPVIECTSQLKWLWFTRRQKLSDFDAFDEASRGPTGSLMLLGKIGATHLASLGALIAILSIAFGAFAQQVVTYPLRQEAAGIASTPLVLNYTGDGNILSEQSATLQSSSLLAAIYNGLIGDISLNDVTPSCSTGNCTWDAYPSLGICPTIIDLSANISSHTCNLTAFEDVWGEVGFNNPGYPCINYTLPFDAVFYEYDNLTEEFGYGSVSLSNVLPLDPSGYPTSVQVLNLVSSAGISNSSINTAYILYQPGFATSINSSLANPIAYALSLDLCVQTLQTTVTGGQVNTTVVSSQILEKGLIEDENLLSEVIAFNNLSDLAVDGFDFGVTQRGIGLLSATLGNLMSDTCYQLFNNSEADLYGLNEDGLWCFFPMGQTILDDMLSSDPLAALQETMGNIATSLTNAFRQGAAGDAETIQFRGIAFSPQTYVGTDYVWLIFPISLITLTLIFLLATIIKSHRLGSRVWKSSNMAVMQGLHKDLHAKLGGLSSISEMDEKGELIRVRFNMDDGKANYGGQYRLVESKQEGTRRMIELKEQTEDKEASCTIKEVLSRQGISQAK